MLNFLLVVIYVVVNERYMILFGNEMQGLINALTNVVPDAEHRFYVMHLYRNMVVNHKGIILRKLLWLAARATTEYQFNKKHEKVEKGNIFTSIMC